MTPTASITKTTFDRGRLRALRALVAIAGLSGCATPAPPDGDAVGVTRWADAWVWAFDS